MPAGRAPYVPGRVHGTRVPSSALCFPVRCLMYAYSRMLCSLGAAVFTAVVGVACNSGSGSHEQRVSPNPPSEAGPAAGESYLWRPVAIGGGGFITGLSMDAGGAVRVARADVYGAYIWNTGQNRWVQLVNSDSMPEPLRVQDGGNEGVFEIVVAPSRPERVYMAFKGNIYRSDNAGADFIATPINAGTERLAFDPNSTWRHNGPVMAVGIANPDLVFFGSPNDGLWRSESAGANWTRITSVPYKGAPDDPGARPGMPVWIQHPSEGMAERIWIMAADFGMHVSDDNGHSFYPLSAATELQPRTLRQGAFTARNSFLGVDYDGRTVWRYRDGAWTDLAETAGLTRLPYASVAVDPISAQIYLFDEGGRAFRSNDDGDSWSSLARSSTAGPDDPPWLRVSDQSYFAMGHVMFDPSVAHRLWVTAGTGIYYADLTPDSTAVRWVSQTRGIEELVANDVVQTPGRAPLFAAWDFGIHVKPDLNVFSSTYGPKERVLIAAQQLATSTADPDFIVTNASDTRTFCCAEDGDAVLAGYSFDAGRSWLKFATLPQPPGTTPEDPWRMSFGTIAVASGDARNIVWQPTYNRSPFYTKDRGASWRRVVLPGEQLPFTGSHAVYSYARKTLVADPVLPAVFYLVHSGGGDNAQLQGLWRSEDGGASWRMVFKGEVAPSSRYSAKLRAVPGHAGHLFFTSGVSHEADMALRRSIDGGISWESLPAVQRVDDVAFGKAAEGSSYPTIFVSAQVSGEYGIWRSTDDARSWKRVADFPVGTLDQVTVLGADPDRFGRVYVGYKGSGWRYGEPAECTASPYSFPAIEHCYQVR